MIEKQRKVAQIAEMIHTASLVHDDVIDAADSRRGKPSINVLWGQKKVLRAHHKILSLQIFAFLVNYWRRFHSGGRIRYACTT